VILLESAYELHAYHASARASNSKLQVLEEKGARGYKLECVDRVWTREDTAAFQTGRVVEDGVQRPESMARYVVRPEGMKFNTSEGKAWKREQEDKGLEVVEPGAVATTLELLKTLPEYPFALSLMQAATKQVTVAHDVLTQWPALPGLQCRPDWLCLEGAGASEWLPYSLDLKTTSDFDSLCTGKGLVNWGYHRQAAIARLCLALDGFADWKACKFYLLVAEKAFPYRWRVVEIPEELLERGERWAMRQLERLNGHYARDEWPLVESEFVVADVPRWTPASEAA
jgi:hypothetical protein